jgi:ribA/ribD-fused uncharacterized protein
MSEKFTFFWSGPFSQWHRCKFTVDGVEYNCAEQYMMHQKALFFGDKETAKKILETTSPKAQKALGRQVTPFDQGKWEGVARDVVLRGNLAKFKQNPDLLEKLLATKGTTLVEASPYDKIWGIGLKEDDPKAQDRATWRGKNWLGQVLTAARELFETGQDEPDPNAHLHCECIDEP